MNADAIDDHPRIRRQTFENAISLNPATKIRQF
jgi:hypothetical protein